MIRRILLGLLAVLLLLVAYLFINFFRFSSQQPEVAPLAPIAVEDSVAERLAGAIRFPTISRHDPSLIDTLPFAEQQAYLAETYPLVHQSLDLRLFDRYGMLFRWRGKNEALDPIVLMGHLDVVPVNQDKLDAWSAPPFSGAIQDGYIIGRGALDDKSNVLGILESAEKLLQTGYQPPRTVYFAFGHDEEVSGHRGARRCAAYMDSIGVSPAMILDEGLFIAKDMVPGLDAPAALIGTAEKGYMTVELMVDLAGGHSSIPAKETAIDILAGAVARLKQNPMPATFSPPLTGFVEAVGPELGFAEKLVFANASLMRPLLFNIYSGTPSGNALIRTTTAPTIIQGGQQDNVIPATASATINFRLLPGDDSTKVLAHLTKVIDDDRVHASVLSYTAASPSSPSEGPAFEYLQRTIKAVFPEVVIAPNLMIGATDSRHFTGVSQHVYRFSPFILNGEEVSMIHGEDEKIRVEHYKNLIRFYHQILSDLASLSAP